MQAGVAAEELANGSPSCCSGRKGPSRFVERRCAREDCCARENRGIRGRTLFLRAGEAIASESVPRYAILDCLEGDLTVYAMTDIRLGGGDWVFLGSGERRSVSALENSSLLLTILSG